MQAKAWDPSRLLTAASGWVDPQDATSGSFWRYDHYSGYVRLTYHAGLSCQHVSSALITELHEAAKIGIPTSTF